MTQEIKKPCTLCLLAPIISFVVIDFIISLSDSAHTRSWLLFQLLFGSFYVKNYAFEEGKDNKQEDTKKNMKLSNIMLCLMTGIALRDIGLVYCLT